MEKKIRMAITKENVYTPRKKEEVKYTEPNIGTTVRLEAPAETQPQSERRRHRKQKIHRLLLCPTHLPSTSASHWLILPGRQRARECG